jgi:hypothetical protein
VAAAEAPRRLLGQLLVEAGVLSTDQLAQALAEQQKSGGLLGEVIVAQGLASRHEVARALAEQSGLVLDQELGFGSGLLDEIRRRHEGQPREAPDGEPGLASVLESLARGYELLRIEPDPREGPAADRERDLELKRLRAELSLVRKELGERTHRLTKALASRDQHDLVRDRLRREREDPLTRATSESAELKRRLEATEQEVSALERALQEREHERAEPHAGNQPRQALDSHLVFVPQGGSYELLESPGPPPNVGESVAAGENGDRYFLVAKVARSPLPLDPRSCAYLCATD